MPHASGLEGRFAGHLTKNIKITDKKLHDSDSARTVAANYRDSIAILQNQSESINTLFATATRSVRALHDFQQSSGVKQVRVIPLPTKTIMASKGQQLGYVKLSMEFMSEILVDCLDEMLELVTENNRKDKIISQIALHEADLPLIGKLQDIELDDLENDSPISTTRDEPDSDTELEEEEN